MPDTDIPAAIQYLQSLVEPVNHDVYGPFREEAEQRLRGRDEEDWPVLAAALAFSCPIWTEDTDFFGTGIAVWTSDRIELFLQAEVRSLQVNQSEYPES